MRFIICAPTSICLAIKCLVDAGVQEGDVLRLQPNPKSVMSLAELSNQPTANAKEQQSSRSPAATTDSKTAGYLRSFLTGGSSADWFNDMSNGAAIGAIILFVASQITSADKQTHFYNNNLTMIASAAGAAYTISRSNRRIRNKGIATAT